MPQRIVVVGHAAITCLGPNMDLTWQRLIRGESGIQKHEAFSGGDFLQDIAGVVPDFGPGTPNADPAVSKLEARCIHLALAAAREAWAQAGPGVSACDPHRVAVLVGSALGGLDLLDTEQAQMMNRKNRAISPFVIPGLIINQCAGQISQHLGLYGPSVAPANACASGGHAIALGSMFLKSGEAEIAICGAAESAFTPAVVNGFATMKALLGKRREDRSLTDPSQSSRPFSADRAGFVLSEGAGMVVLATEAAAKKYDLPIQAVYHGHAINSDGYHMSMPSKEKIVHCLNSALNRAEIRPEDVDYYNAHGTSTVVNDRTETEVLKEVFGAQAARLPVSSIKGAIGHSLGAASAIEAAVSVRTLQEQLIPPTINHLRDPELDLDYVPGEARSAQVETVMSASFGFGGTNNALIFGRWKG
ncbi:beta-ketoacyl-[acyl-carrier-protein] synthase family protein [Singulisphaera sp. PoT]|uniref:beta-ketoacyl-[acyl-carrier-protein] synthase family protein n=1 Tax=Singulisphaera sp. PoT TaxID=3411797 RepID=UPI003BF553C8